jgi:site-specific DNA-methyltransferase (adenine-specific)
MTQVYNRDCMEAMKEFPDKFFELAIVDPPYGIGADDKNSTNKKQSNKSAGHSKDYGDQQWDNGIPDKAYFDELTRVSHRQVIWGANYYGLVGGYLYWHKNVTMPTYSSWELAWLSWLNKIDFVEITWHGMIQGDMKNKEDRIHPTQKPIALYKWLLKNYAKEGDKILDTHLGSGSSRIAADSMGFDFWGYELDKEYFDASCKRFDQYKAQLNLF